MAHAGATRAVTLKKPAGAAVGDVLVASFTVDHTPTLSATPAGWTSLLSGPLRAGNRTSLFAFYRVVSAADVRTTGWTWTLSRRQAWSGGVARYVGVDPVRPIDTSVSVASSGSARASITVPSVTTTRRGTMLIGSVGAAGGTSATTPPAGWRQAWDKTRGKVAEHAYRPRPAAGVTGGRTWRVRSARALAGWMTALRPATGAPPPPTASFTVAPSQGALPLSVQFTDASTGAPTSWSWNFGDGSSGAVQHPSHTYATAGSYTVTLRATNASGSSTVTKIAAVIVQGISRPNVLVGAGDIADCAFTNDSATAALINATPGSVFTLGDNAYPNGSTADFANCYEPTWGSARARTRPVAGNHEYMTPNAAPYYAYFGASAGAPTSGWYSYDIGTDWHVVVLNSNCTFVGGCGAGSPQEQWLRSDLAASTRACTVAMWHHPRFSSGQYGSDTSTAAFWQDLYQDGAELVLNGHEHDYERFAPQNPSGVADAAYGIREIVVGTGGQELRAFRSVAAANSEVRSATVYGVLKLTLDSGRYDWTFLPTPGSSLTDSGTTFCHGPPS